MNFMLLQIAKIVLGLSCLYFYFEQEHPSQPYQKKSKLQKYLSNSLHKIELRIDDWISKLHAALSSPRRRYYRTTTTYKTTLKQNRVKTNVFRAICMATILSASTTTARTARKGDFDTDSRKLLIDNCATASITNNINDCNTTPVPIKRTVKGIGGLLQTQVYSTTIKWDIEDDDGKKHEILLPKSFYIPTSPSRLLSPQHWARTARDTYPLPRGTRCITYDTAVELQWDQRKYKRTIPLDTRGSNVAELTTASGYDQFNSFCTLAGQVDYINDDSNPVALEANIIEDDTEDNTDMYQDTDLDDEHPEQYFPTRDIPLTTDFPIDGPNQGMPTIIPDEEDIIIQDESAELLRYHHRTGHTPMSKLQEMALQKMIPSRLAKCRIPICTACAYGKASRKPWRVKGHQNRVRTVTRPGQCISVDQLISPTPGYIAQLRGTPTTKRYLAATIFVDQFSGAGFIHLQKTTSAEETIEGKERFEAWAETHGVSIQHYHADNGIFADNKFRKAVANARQTLSFCGVNAHFQNGMAERRVRELQDNARTMLIHANRRWNTAVDAHLWPYAIRYACDMFNEAPMKKHKGLTPIQKFSGSEVAFNIRHAHTFGCPVYVLDNVLQQRKKIPKWSERSRVGIFLGYSPQHARSVALILSLSSGLTSPQFHIQFDDGFQTMRSSFGEASPESAWQFRTGFSKQRPSIDVTMRIPSASENNTTEATTTPPVQREPPDLGQSGPQQRELDTGSIRPGENPPDNPSNEARRSARQHKPTERYLSYMEERDPNFVAYEAITYLQLDPSGDFHPLEAYKASSDPDTIYWHEAMRAPDRKDFLKAAEKEVIDHTVNGLWEVIHKRKVPQGALIAPGVWSMKRKRRIGTREVYKWKARLAYDGSRQTMNVNYWDTYAPVVSWPIVRYVLTLALTQNWKIKQIDYVLAYTQAPAETDMYMKPPKGFKFDGENSDDYVLKIKKNYYGQKQAGRVWNRHLTEKLKEAGFQQSDQDECLFYHGSSIYVLYTDDSLLTGPDEKELNLIIDKMKSVGLKLTHEDGVDDFLGVNVQRHDDGTIHLTQPHLIKSILEDLRLAGTTVAQKKTPCAVTVILWRHLDADPFDQHFHYRSAIGKLNYLEKSTRPDIAYATHQCARFSQDPREPHGKAVKWIGRYLNATRDKGLILRPDLSKGFEVYADADFAGNFNKLDAPADPDTARSRTGYLVYYAGCPIFWQSKLQTEISLSTTEAEIISMSTALKTTIPLMEITKEMQELGFNILSTKPTVHCRLFEDNSGAIELATNRKVRPRTRYMNVKWFHFRHHYDRGEISILPCRSEDMTADFLTKPLDTNTFQRHRMAVNGW
jgi:hypothetical protein